jgi:hypothetical protein
LNRLQALYLRLGDLVNQFTLLEMVVAQEMQFILPMISSMGLAGV